MTEAVIRQLMTEAIIRQLMTEAVIRQLMTEAIIRQLMTEAASTSESSVSYQTTWHYMLEDSHLFYSCHENLKPHHLLFNLIVFYFVHY
jgi:hypothetical protein